MFKDIDLENCSLSELKNYCIDNYNVRPAEVNQYGRKKGLIEFIKTSFDESDSVFEDLEEVEHYDVEGEPLAKDVKIKRTDSEWTSWVLDHLETDEKKDEVPTVDGLKRLVEKFIGDILSIKTNVIQAPGSQNGYVATVKSTIKYFDKELNCVCEYDGTSEVQKEETNWPYSKFLTSSAETKAESRAYRKILRLKNIMSYEEQKQDEQYKNDDSSSILEEQLFFLDNLCNPGRNNLNVPKIFSLVTGKTNSVRTYSSSDASNVIAKINEWQSKPDEIPDQVKGYDPEWKK